MRPRGSLRTCGVWAVMVFGVIGAVTFSAVGLLLGVRLVLLWRRTGKLPELLIGLAFLFEAVISNSLNVVEKFQDRFPAGLRGPVYSGIVISSCAAAVCLLIAAWRIFRPGRAWVSAGVGIFIVLLSLYSLDTMMPHSGGYGPRNLVWWWVAILGRFASHAWIGTEAYYYQRMMRRRLRLGLADPVVADRMWLWALAGWATALLWLGVGVARTVGGAEGVHHPYTLLWISGLGFVASVTNWLVFLPPRAYLQMIERRASATAGAA